MNKNGSSQLWKFHTREVIQATLFVILVGFLFWLLLRFRGVIFILFSAILLSTAITPPVDWLHRRGLPRAVGVILIYFLLAALLLGFVAAVMPMLLNQAAGISSDLASTYEDFQGWMLTSPSSLIRRLALTLPEEPIPPVEDNGQLPVPEPAPDEDGQETAVIDQVRGVFTALGLMARAVFVMIALFLLAFYWTLDGKKTLRSLLLLVTPTRREGIREMLEEIQDRVGGYLRGVFILSLIVGGLALVAYLLIGVPYAFLLAVVAGVMEAIPVVGPALGAIPAVLVAYSFGNPSMVIAVLIVNGAIQLLENLFLVPRVMGRSVGVNPLVSLLALVTFSSLLGFAGALLAIPLAAVIQILLNRYVLEPGAVDQAIPEGRDTISALRLDIQELNGDIRKQVRDKEHPTSLENDLLEDSIEEIAIELDHLLKGASQGEEELE